MRKGWDLIFILQCGALCITFCNPDTPGLPNIFRVVQICVCVCVNHQGDVAMTGPKGEGGGGGGHLESEHIARS